ncbi:rCG24549 [Rattus norvegicus]|uniref:RCG24549 n=1 Tax=Rattus norvegicus TaxID=10116 RepID=A6JBK6_RAT|nr:rCG24549 [Rattus norvegicus]
MHDRIRTRQTISFLCSFFFFVFVMCYVWRSEVDIKCRHPLSLSTLFVRHSLSLNLELTGSLGRTASKLQEWFFHSHLPSAGIVGAHCCTYPRVLGIKIQIL